MEQQPERKLTELEKRLPWRRNRPHTEIDWAEAERFAACWGTLAGISAALMVSEDVLQDAIRREYSMTFTQWAHQFRERTSVVLMEELINRALSGDGASLRFLAERKLGMTAKVEITHMSAADQLQARIASMTPEELKAELTELAGLLESKTQQEGEAALQQEGAPVLDGEYLSE